MGKLINLLLCDFCKKPIRKRQLRDFQLFIIPLCDKCYEDYMKTFRGF